MFAVAFSKCNSVLPCPLTGVVVVCLQLYNLVLRVSLLPLDLGSEAAQYEFVSVVLKNPQGTRSTAGN